MEYVRTACQSVCPMNLFKTIPEGQQGMVMDQENVKVSGFIKTPCDTDGCCLRHTDICYDPIHNMLVKKQHLRMLLVKIHLNHVKVG